LKSFRKRSGHGSPAHPMMMVMLAADAQSDLHELQG
jgi:hypothetical protein